MNDKHPPQLDALRADYQRLLQRLEANQRQFNHLARSVYRLQEDERRRLARDLHDGLGQNLTALTHQLGLLLDGLPPGGTSREQAERALQICRSTLEDTRQMSRLLRPQVLDDLGLNAALRWLCRTVSEPAGLHCELEQDETLDLDPELQTVAFRIVQEALTNTVRHAAAEHVSVQLHVQGGWLSIVIEDDGVGLDPKQLPQGSGLGGMRERLRLFGGELQIQPCSPHGTRLRALLPMDASDERG